MNTALFDNFHSCLKVFVNLSHENPLAASSLASRGMIVQLTHLLQVKEKFPPPLKHDLVMQLVGLCINLVEKSESNRKIFLTTPKSAPKTRQKRQDLEVPEKSPLQVILEHFQELQPSFQENEDNQEESSAEKSPTTIILPSLSQVSWI